MLVPEDDHVAILHQHLPGVVAIPDLGDNARNLTDLTVCTSDVLGAFEITCFH